MPPWIYLRGLAIFAFTGKPPAYLLGHTYPHGVWFFFPAFFLLKSPLAFLLLLLLALVVGLVAKFRPVRLAVIPEGMELHWRATWIFLVIFTGACILSRFQFSIRHFSVSYALLILLLAPLPRALKLLRSSGWPAARAGLWITAALALVSIATAVRAYPNYLPFLAPNARRTAISRCRAPDRAINWFARLAQAISNTRPTIAISISNGRE